MRFGDWLREKRLERGWRQADVAKRAGVSLSYISAIERGERHHLSDSPTLPKRDVVIAIARALGEDVTETLMIAGYAPEEPSKLDILERDDIKIALFTGTIPPEHLEEFKRTIEIAVEIFERQMREKQERDDEKKSND